MLRNNPTTMAADNPNLALFLRAGAQALLHWGTLKSIVAHTGTDDAKDKALWLAEVVPAWFLDTPDGAQPCTELAPLN